jgi:hypothetical protein
VADDLRTGLDLLSTAAFPGESLKVDAAAARVGTLRA